MVGAQVGHQYFEGESWIYLRVIHRSGFAAAHLFDYGMGARTQALFQIATKTSKYYLGAVNESD